MSGGEGWQADGRQCIHSVIARHFTAQRNMRIPWSRRSCGWALGALLAVPVGAQPVAPVKLDLGARSVDPSPVPFNRLVELRGTVPTDVDAMVLALREVARFGAPLTLGADPAECLVWVRTAPASPSQPGRPDKPGDPAKPATPNALASNAQFSFQLERPLLQNRRYAISIRVANAPAGGYFPAEVLDRDGDPITCGYIEAAKPLPLDPTTPLDSDAKATLTDTLTVFFITDAPYQSHFDSDAGVLYAYRAGYAGAATGVHLYARPITADEDLARADLTSWEEYGRRLSLHFGFAIQEIGTSANLSAPTGAGVPFVGIGLRGPLYWEAVQKGPADSRRRQWQRRLLQGMRVSVGSAWFRQEDPNPLVTETRTKRDVYSTLTLDLALRDLLSPFGRFFK